MSTTDNSKKFYLELTEREARHVRMLLESDALRQSLRLVELLAGGVRPVDDPHHNDTRDRRAMSRTLTTRLNTIGVFR